jgi:hypothetical protein
MLKTLLQAPDPKAIELKNRDQLYDGEDIAYFQRFETFDIQRVLRVVLE